MHYTRFKFCCMKGKIHGESVEEMKHSLCCEISVSVDSYTWMDPSIQWPYSPYRALASWGSVTAVFLWCGVVSPAPNLEHQVSVFMTPGDRVAQLYPRALGSSGTSGTTPRTHYCVPLRGNVNGYPEIIPCHISWMDILRLSLLYIALYYHCEMWFVTHIKEYVLYAFRDLL
jgi:hypothetical protein